MQRAVILMCCGLLTLSRPVQACLYALDPNSLVKTLPSHGEDAVPTDVAILVETSNVLGSDAAPPEGFLALRDEAGELVPGSVERVAAWHVQLRPTSPLAPNSTYQLDIRVSAVDGSPLERTVSFTTGAGPVEVDSSPPTGVMQHWRFAADVELSSCDPGRVGTCVAVHGEELVEATFVTQDGMTASSYVYLYQGSFTGNFTPGEQADCVQLRRRFMNATYGEPTVLCGEDAPMLELTGSADLSCTADGIVHEGTLASSPSGDSAGPPQAAAGCRVSRGSTSRLWALGSCLAAALSWTRRRTAVVLRRS